MTHARKNPQLIKGKDLVGLKVITLQKGQNIEDVDELIYDPGREQIVALVVDPGGWFSDAKVILYKDIRTIGEDAVIIESDRVLKRASDVKQKIQRILKGDNYLTENVIITEDGTELGKVSDVYFNPVNGKVVELEVSQGMKNFQSGKKRVKVSDVVKIGEDATIVKTFVEEKLEEQANRQGIQGALVKSKAATQEKAPDLIEQTKDKVQELSQKLQDSFEEVKDDPENKKRFMQMKKKTIRAKDTVFDSLQGGKDIAKEKAAQGIESAEQKVNESKEQIKETQKKNALGKYITINILSATDQLLARRGDMITHKLLSQAEKNGMLEQVLANTSREPLPGSASRHVKSPTDTISVPVDTEAAEAPQKVYEQTPLPRK